MATLSVRIHDVVRVLQTNGFLVRNWEQLCGALDIADCDRNQWANNYRTGIMTIYELFSSMLSKWEAGKGSGANVGALISVLMVEGFVSVAELLRTTAFPQNAKNVETTVFTDRVEPLEPGNEPICRTRDLEQNRNLAPQDDKELETSLVNCQAGDTICLAKNTKYFGHLTLRTNNVTLVGGPGCQIRCEDARTPAILIAGDGCGMSGVTVKAARDMCTLVEGSNNKIHNCQLFNVSGPIALLVRGRNNILEKVTITLNGGTVENRPSQIGLFVECESTVCCKVGVGLQKHLFRWFKPKREVAVDGVASTTNSEGARFENCCFLARGLHSSHQILGSAHRLLDVNFEGPVVVSQNHDTIRMERCSATKLQIADEGKLIWESCKFRHIQHCSISIQGARC